MIRSLPSRRVKPYSGPSYRSRPILNPSDAAMSSTGTGTDVTPCLSSSAAARPSGVIRRSPVTTSACAPRAGAGTAQAPARPPDPCSRPCAPPCRACGGTRRTPCPASGTREIPCGSCPTASPAASVQPPRQRAGADLAVPVGELLARVVGDHAQDHCPRAHGASVPAEERPVEPLGVVGSGQVLGRQPVTETEAVLPAVRLQPEAPRIRPDSVHRGTPPLVMAEVIPQGIPGLLEVVVLVVACRPFFRRFLRPARNQVGVFRRFPACGLPVREPV